MNMSIAKSLISSSHIAMEMAIIEDDNLQSQQPGLSTVEDQGVDLDAVGKYFEDGEDKSLPFEVSALGKSNFGVIISPDMEGDVIQLCEECSVAKLLTLEATDILESKYYTDDRALLDVKAGSVFAVSNEYGITVYCSKGANVGDKEIQVVAMPGYIQTPINYLLIRAFDRQNACIKGDLPYTEHDYYMQLM